MLTLYDLAVQQFADPELSEVGLPEDILLAVDGDDIPTSERLDAALAVMRATRSIVVAVSATGAVHPDVAATADLCLVPSTVPAARPRHVVPVDEPTADLARLDAAVAAHPVAALTLAWLLRAQERMSVPDALAAESAAFSTLLAGDDFRRWLAGRGTPRPPESAHRVQISRDGNELMVLLNRPQRRNAVDAAMRHELLEALRIAAIDPHVHVVLQGAGPSFSAGGDLDEFGTAEDLAVAHVTRTVASVGAAIWRIADRVTVRAHGVCAGAGIELAAFAGHVIARADSEFFLPEIDLGLIPGAGGTVSMTRRMGRQRLLWMALTAARLPARVGLDWGLIDAVD